VAADTPQQTTPELPVKDAELIDLLTAVLVDPNLDTDLSMRLHREISAVLRAVHRNLYGESGGAFGHRALEAESSQLPDLLATVLVDPNLHSDLRMRLHRDIRTILRAVETQLGV
jgi:hypothetical protein